MPTREPAAIYCRISDDKRGEGTGVHRQERACRDLADRLGCRVEQVLVDNDVSAYSGRQRPAYQELLQLIRSGRIKYVLAWHNDRLHRSPRELEDYITAVEAHGVTTHFVSSGQVDLATASGRAMARQLGTWARYESEHRAERITAAHESNARRGKYRGGTTRIFGYKPDGLTLHPVEAPAIQAAYQDLLAGKSMYSIIHGWNDRGLTTAGGKQWGHMQFKQVMLRARNYGASVYKGEVVGTGEWQPLVDEGTWRAAQRILTDPTRKRNTSNQGRFLLSGLARCGKCAADGRVVTMKSGIVKSGGDRVRYYSCKASAHLSIRLEPADEFITELVLARLTHPDSPVLRAPLQGGGPSPSDLQAQVTAARGRLDDLAEAFGDGELTRDQHARQSAKVRAQLAHLEEQLTAEAGSGVLGDLLTTQDVRSMWDTLQWKQKRDVINALMTITVAPVGKGYVRRFQPERLQVEWR